jgi:hypothetical protein
MRIDYADHVDLGWNNSSKELQRSRARLQQLFFDTAPGCFERHRSDEPPLTPIPLIRAVDPPDAGAVAVAVSVEQAMIRPRRSDAHAVSKKGLSFTVLSD